MPNALQIIYAGAGFVAVHKPGGIPTEAYGDHDTVEARAWRQFQRPGSPKKPYVGIVHRLDRPVSGALLLAINISTLRRLNEVFARKQAQKTYLALTQVPLPEESGTLKDYLLKDNMERRARVTDRNASGAKLSTLKYRLVSEGPEGYRYEINPITGRYHQIRAQLAAAGAPIVGDDKYGSKRPYLPHRIALHASRLVFPDSDGNLITIDCPPAW